MLEGWFKTYRKMREWQHYQEPTVVLVWLDLLISANTKDGWHHGHRLRRGEFFTSVATIQEHTGLDAKTIRKALDKLVATGEIKREANNEGSKITINQFIKYQGSGNNPQPTPQRLPQPTPEPNPQPTPQRLPYQQEYIEGKELIKKQERQDDDNAHASGQSVVVGLRDFLNNIYGDFNFTPSQVQLVMSKPADYWESFMDEVQASKWLKTKDPAFALRLHEKVVAGEYHTYPEKTKPEPTIPQPIQHQPTKEELYVQQLVEEWETLVNTDPVGANYPKLNELKLKHGQLPSAFLEEIGMQYYAGGWHFKY